MHPKSLLISLVFSFGVFFFGFLHGTIGSASETVKSSAKGPRANSTYKTTGGTSGETVEEILKGDVFKKKFAEETVLKKFRELRGCAGPNFEKDLLMKKSPEPALTCSNLLTYEGAREKSDDLSKLCKAGCMKAGKGKATGTSAAALENCLNKSCEKECEFQNLTRKVEVDSFIRGALDQNQYDAESL